MNKAQAAVFSRVNILIQTAVCSIWKLLLRELVLNNYPRRHRIPPGQSGNSRLRPTGTCVRTARTCVWPARACEWPPKTCVRLRSAGGVWLRPAGSTLEPELEQYVCGESICYQVLSRYTQTSHFTSSPVSRWNNTQFLKADIPWRW